MSGSKVIEAAVNVVAPQNQQSETPVRRALTASAEKSLLTVVVPTKNSGRTLDRCLRSISTQVGHDGAHYPIELVVVDNYSTDETAQIAAARADLVSLCGPERSAQRNRGLQLATRDFILFVDSDMVLETHVCVDVVAALQSLDCGGVVVPEESFGDGFWACCRALEKRIAIGDPGTEAARGFRVSQLRDIGGWNESLTAAEDWELTDRIVGTGSRIDRAQARIFHDEGHPTLRGNFEKKRYYGRWMATYLRASKSHMNGSTFLTRTARLSPLRIFRRPRLLLENPAVSLGLVALKTVDAIGIGLGVLSARRSVARPVGIATQQ